jgi:protein TonB
METIKMKTKTLLAIAVLVATPSVWAVKTPGLGAEDSGPVKIAGDVQSLRAITQVKPTYPELAKMTHTEGAVVLQISITKEGSVSKVEVVTGPPLLTRAAQEAVKQWKYKPTIINGQAVEVITNVRVAFALK